MEHVADGEQADEHAEVADAGDEERLLAGGGCRRAGEVEGDEEVGAEPHEFPPGVHHQEVAGEDQEEHREDEQVEVGEEPALVLVVGHVADGVPVDEHPDAGDDQDHHHGQGIDAEVDGGPEVPGHHPAEQVPDDEALATRQFGEPGQDRERHDEGPRDEHGRQVAGHLRQPLAE